jgi:hypothetical protein
MLSDINNSDDLYITEDVDGYEDHADGLMDALFGEVEHILSVESTETRAIAPVKSRQYSAPNHRANNQGNSPRLLPSDTVSITKLDLPALAIPSISQQDMIWIGSHGAGQVAHGSEMVLSDTKFLQGELQREFQGEFQGAPEQKTDHLLDRVIAIAACTSVIFAASIWTARYGLADIIQQRTAALPSAPSQLDPDTAEFADEIKQSFIVISNKEREKTVAASS